MHMTHSATPFGTRQASPCGQGPCLLAQVSMYAHVAYGNGDHYVLCLADATTQPRLSVR